MAEQGKHREQVQAVHKHAAEALEHALKARDAVSHFKTGPSSFRHMDATRLDALVQGAVKHLYDAIDEAKKELEESS